LKFLGRFIIYHDVRKSDLMYESDQLPHGLIFHMLDHHIEGIVRTTCKG
jgi:hypothetical protein